MFTVKGERALAFVAFHYDGPQGTVTELLFERKELVPEMLLLFNSQ
jgi:hypothetical protein